MKQKRDIVCSGVFAAIGALSGAICSWGTYLAVSAGEPAWCAAVFVCVGVVGVVCSGIISREVDY